MASVAAVIQTTKARLNHCLGRVLTKRCSRTSQERGETAGDAARVFPLPSLVLVTWDPWPYLPPHSCRPQSHHIATRIWCFNHRVWLTLVLSVTRIQKPVPDRSQISLSGATASEVWLASLVGTPSQDPPPPKTSAGRHRLHGSDSVSLGHGWNTKANSSFFLQFGADYSGVNTNSLPRYNPESSVQESGEDCSQQPLPASA